MSNTSIILVGEEGIDPVVITNGVHLMTILQSLYNIQNALSEKLRNEARMAVGDNPAAQEKYLEKLIYEYWEKPRRKGRGRSGGLNHYNVNLS